VSEVEHEVLACIEAGASAYAPQSASLDELIAVLQHVVRGEALCSPRVAGSLFRRITMLAGLAHTTSAPQLTPPEHQVLGLIERRMSNKQIASELCIGLATVKNHVHNILDKLHAESREQAIRHARRPLGNRG